MKRRYWISVLTIYFKIIYLKILDMILLVISFYLVKKLAIVLAYISIFFKQVFLYKIFFQRRFIWFKNDSVHPAFLILFYVYLLRDISYFNFSSRIRPKPSPRLTLNIETPGTHFCFGYVFFINKKYVTIISPFWYLVFQNRAPRVSSFCLTPDSPVYMDLCKLSERVCYRPRSRRILSLCLPSSGRSLPVSLKF